MLSLELNTEISQEFWVKLYPTTLRMTKSTRLRYFQYRLLHKKLVTNLHRSKWDEQVSELCSLCTQETETVLHLLWEYQKVKKIWDNLARWLKYILRLDQLIAFSPESVILNTYEGQCAEIINRCILATKQYIYACKCQKIELSFINLAQRFYDYQNLERLIANEMHKN